MRKSLFYASLSMLAVMPVFAQEGESAAKEKDGYVFTIVKENPITSIKNQNRSGTCWSFSGLGFLESELIRKGKSETDLAEMFVVYHSYADKADKYVRMDGKINFAAGGSFYDVLYVMKNYGALPESVYSGIMYDESKHVHNELDAVTKGYVDGVLTNKKFTNVWKKGFNSILDAYLGEIPERFTYEGKEYTPKSYAESLGLDMDDYVSITSYTHHPFYTSFPLEIADNWRWSQSYNVPLDEMMEIMDNAINNGYTIAWGSDVSEKGFNRKGLGVLLDTEGVELAGSDQARWLGLSRSDREAEIEKMMEGPGNELSVTQESRQKGYDNHETTDDHGMVIYGIAKDQTGKKFYMIKNSWGEIGRAHV